MVHGQVWGWLEGKRDVPGFKSRFSHLLAMTPGPLDTFLSLGFLFCNTGLIRERCFLPMEQAPTCDVSSAPTRLPGGSFSILGGCGWGSSLTGASGGAVPSQHPIAHQSVPTPSSTPRAPTPASGLGSSPSALTPTTLSVHTLGGWEGSLPCRAPLTFGQVHSFAAAWVLQDLPSPSSLASVPPTSVLSRF